MGDNFTSNDNKAMLWQFLFEEGAFNDISDTYISHIKKNFDDAIVEINNKHKNNINLTQKNKKLISEMVAILGMYKKKPENIMKPLEELKIDLDTDLKNKNEEFLQLIKRPNPKEIDFSDKNDEPMDSNSINNMLNKMMETRQKELNQISITEMNKESTSNIDSKSSETSEISEVSEINDNVSSVEKKTSIKDEIKNYITDDKRVSFNFEEIHPITNDVSISNKEILDYLKILVNNQNKILLILENNILSTTVP
jgi:hypothetical protein